MTTLDSTALWSATALAFDEHKVGNAGLSVRQRKLLARLSQPASVQLLAQTIALPIEEVHSVLERFAKLGLAQSNVEEPVSPMQVRVTAHTAAVADTPSRTPMYIGIAVAALAVVAAAAWFLRSGSSSTPAPQTAATAAPKAASGPATGPADTADSVTPRTAAASPAAGASPATAAPPPAPAAAAKSAAAPAAPTAAATTPAAATKAAATPATPAAATKAAPATAAPATAAPATATAAPATAAAAPAPATAPATAAAPATTPPPAATVAAAPPPAAAPAPAPAAARPAPAAREIKLVSRVDPGFPRGIDADKGAVKARLQVDARGAVTGVEIIESNPPRVFDRAVRNALQQWRYEPTGEAFTVQAEINFSR